MLEFYIGLIFFCKLFFVMWFIISDKKCVLYIFFDYLLFYFYVGNKILFNNILILFKRENIEYLEIL